MDLHQKVFLVIKSADVKKKWNFTEVVHAANAWSSQFPLFPLYVKVWQLGRLSSPHSNYPARQSEFF